MEICKTVFISVCLGTCYCMHAQTIATTAGSLTWNPNGLNAITTAVPFLRLNPDARAGGMGDVGIATPGDVNSVYVNPAKLAFINGDGGVSASYAPWLGAGIKDIFITSLNGYYRIRKKQVIALSARYFSNGNVSLTNVYGQTFPTFKPKEFVIDAHYARQLGRYFSISGSLRFIYSNLVTGFSGYTSTAIKPAMAGAGDIGWYFHRTWHQNEEGELHHTFSCGMALTNMGSKMYYSSYQVKDYLPASLGIGFGYKLDIDRYNSFGAYLDLNKLMVPSPYGAYDSATRTWYYREEPPLKGMFTSFGDAPAMQELKYITERIGFEYFYNNLYGGRIGYFYETPSAGGRQFVTLGATARYNIASLHISFLIPTNLKTSPYPANPLNNAMQVTLVFDLLQKVKKLQEKLPGIRV